MTLASDPVRGGTDAPITSSDRRLGTEAAPPYLGRTVVSSKHVLVGLVLLVVACAASDTPADAATDASVGHDPSTSGSTSSSPPDAASSSTTADGSDDDGSSTSAEAPDEPPPPNGKYVLGHWMVRMGRWDANARPQEDYEAVLTELRDYGVDALVVYWDSYLEAADQYAVALDAAEATGTKIGWGVLGYQGVEVRDMIVANKDRPGMFRDPLGRIVVSGFFNTWGLLQNEGYVLDPAGSVQLDDLHARGVDFVYWPDLPYSGASSRAERAAALGSGQFDFFFGENGGVNDHHDWLEIADARLADAQAHGVPYMPPILPFYAAQVTHNWMMFESYGFIGLRAQWMWAIDNDVPAVQLVTVNDYNEHTYLQTFGDGGPVVGPPGNEWWAGVLTLDHSGFGKFMRRYADWFKTDVEPEITEDEFLVAYRPHPRTAVSWADLPQADRDVLAGWLPPNAYPSPLEWATDAVRRIETHDVMDDSVQLCARLAAPAVVTLTVGTSTTRMPLPAGEHILVIEGADISETAHGTRHTFTADQMGYPQVLVERDGATVFDARAELPITPFIVPGTYNYYAAELTES
jgi:hypothetical protein